MRFSPVDANWDLSAGRAQLLEETSVCPDPQVILSDFHLADKGGTVEEWGEKEHDVRHAL